MASSILGLGSSGSSGLSTELIEKLKTAESEARLDPITDEITDTQSELDATNEIEAKIEELLELVKDFDLFTSDVNVFDEMSASTSGSSVSFDANDSSNLEAGTTTVSVEQLAQKDVYQSNTISDTTTTLDSGTINITIGEDSYSFSTEGKTYEELVEEMDNNENIDVSLEKVSDSGYRIVIKSSESGTSNALTITQDSIDLGLEEEDNHVLTAQNMLMNVDGIEYDLSSNKLTLNNGLIITATQTGDSSITLEKDESSLLQGIEDIADKYNELVDLVNSYILGDEDNPAVISDSSTVKAMMNGIKEILFGSYGLEDEESLFNYGFSFDSDGYLQIDSSTLSSAITDNFDDLKELFVGYAEKEGIGTRLKTYLDSMDSVSGGLMSSFIEKLQDRIDTLNDDYDEQSEKLDEKYNNLTEQFAAYTVIITQMENSFASLKLLIEGDSSS